MAKELQSFSETLESLPAIQHGVERVFARLKTIADIPPNSSVLDIGAAAGVFVAACNRLEYRCKGVEPNSCALSNAARLAENLKCPVDVVTGTAESLPFADESFQVVHANSVIEHVGDVELAFAEAYRVLRTGGVFWFYTASSMSPVQSEIRGFPLFGWYPDGLKRLIMNWAKVSRPELVGYTSAPAIHWFTPWKARRLLRKAGFYQVFDRWDLKRTDPGGRSYRTVLRLIRSSAVTKCAADVLIPDCAFAAIKG